MFAQIKTWALAFAGAALAVAAIFKFGERSGKQEAKRRETERRLQSTQDMKEIEHEVSAQDDPHLVNTLDRFVRK